MKRNIFIIILIVSFAVCLSCGSPRVQELTGRVTFVSGLVLLNGTTCEFGSVVKTGDTVATGAKSIAVVQFGQSSIISLKENSNFTVEVLIAAQEADTITITQKIGSSFNKIVKKGTKYSLQTPTSVAAVRGTSFMCTVSDKGSTIKLSSGWVKVIPVIQGNAKEDAAVEIDAGKKIEITETAVSAPQELTKEEQTQLSKLDAIDMLPDVQKESIIEELKKKPEAERPVVVPVEIMQVLEISESTQEEKPKISLNDIEQRYGSLSVVETTDGRTYIGAFAQKGATMQIYTTEGTITVPSSKISKVSRYKREK